MTATREPLSQNLDDYDGRWVAVREGRVVAHADDEGTLRPHLYRYDGEDAARHLYAVAAGLDSMVLGEPQIMGQVRTAWQGAAAASLPGALHTVFSRAIESARHIRSESGFAHHSSVTSAGSKT